MATKRANKALQYAQQLYEARCNRNWKDVPELARKVEKHASDRKCLTLAARAEASLIGSGRQPADVEKEYAEELSAALASEKTGSEQLDANVCLATILYSSKNFSKALDLLAEPLSRGRTPAQGSPEETWETVCIVQGSLVRGLCSESEHDRASASSTYQGVVPYLSSIVQLSRPCLALQRWTEELLVHICIFLADIDGLSLRRIADPQADPKANNFNISTEALPAFSVLSQLLQRQSDKLLVQRGILAQHSARRLWKVFYATISGTLRMSPSERGFDTNSENQAQGSRQEQFAELSRVEKSYETILLQQSRFPKASEATPEIKEWIDLVMSNWETISGPDWKDGDVGPGGKKAVARNILDILYRSMTKTFHSTQILRSLFTIHAFLGEYFLAFKAFDTYIEIATKAKARAEKSGSTSLQSDNDETVLCLASEAIRVSARFGSHDAAEKAYDIGVMMEGWLADPDHLNSPQSPKLTTSIPAKFTNASPAVISLAYRALAISQANWSRYSYDASLRERLQNKAVNVLQLSIEEQPFLSEASERFYCQSVVLAEQRRIPEALNVIKRGLQVAAQIPIPETPLSTIDESQVLPNNTSISTQKLLPMWHLYALLLSAAEDYEGALIACQTALNLCPQSLDLTIPFSTSHIENREDDLIRSLEQLGKASSGISSVGDLSEFDKRTIVELRMTQITLLGLCEGANSAVMFSTRLIALYSQLFGNLDPKDTSTADELNMAPPKSSRGTIRSFFGRPPSSYRSPNSERPMSSVSSMRRSMIMSQPATASSRPATIVNDTPSIQVIDEEEESQNLSPSKANRHSLIHRHADGETRKLRKSVSLRRKASSNLQEEKQKQNHVQDENERPISLLPEKDGVDESQEAEKPTNESSELNGVESEDNDDIEEEINGKKDKRMSLVDFLKKEEPPFTTTKPRDTSPSRPPQNSHHPTPSVPNFSRPTSSAQPNAAPTLPSVPHNIPHDKAIPPIGHKDQPPKQDTRLPVPRPHTSATTTTQARETSPPIDPMLALQSHRLKTTLLVKIWLFVASLYSCVTPPLHPSTQSAIHEASTLVLSLEESVVSARGRALVADFRTTGWGGGKSVDELWADIRAAEGELLVSQAKPHDAIDSFEQALNYHPDHPAATVGLSNILLDIYERSVPLTRPSPSATSATEEPATSTPPPSSPFRPLPLPHPFHLARLAHRDRAYGLLSSLTKLGHSWDNSAAWLALGRALAASGQEDSAREAWVECVRLEETGAVGGSGRVGLVL